MNNLLSQQINVNTKVLSTSNDVSKTIHKERQCHWMIYFTVLTTLLFFVFIVFYFHGKIISYDDDTAELIKSNE